MILAAVVIALVKFQPWTLLAGGDAQGVVSSEVLDRPEQDEDDSEAEGGSTAAAAEGTNWNDYVGFWSAGGLTFELFIEDDELNVTMQLGSRSYWDSADISDAPDAVSVELDGMEVRLKPRDRGALRIAIDGERYDAEPYSGALSPDTENSPTTDAPSLPVDDSGYLYYSPSTGTRSAGGNIPSDSSLHFWPLDQYAISTTELDRLTRDEVDIIRNEVFARHGYIFTTERWNTFFAAYDWYQPDPTFTEARFTKLEKQNIDTIVAYEKAKGWL